MSKSARGIHYDETRKLGRRPPSNAPALRVSSFLNVEAALEFGPTDDNLGKLPFQMYDNDKYGDCGPTSVGNSIVSVTGGQVVPPLESVLDLYRRSGNPGFPNEDNGVIMQDMLDELLANGIKVGPDYLKPLAFGKVDAKNADELMAAIWTFDGALLGVDLQVAQQKQSDAKPPLWDYATPHAGWGGHAIYGGQYEKATGKITVISWQEHVATTAKFRIEQLDEVWVVIWPQHLERPGLDVPAFAAAFKQLTGKTLPLPVAPTPPPVAPVPAPIPVDDSDRALWASQKTWALARHVAGNKAAALALKRWAKAKGLD